jgi:hypothetical protein
MGTVRSATHQTITDGDVSGNITGAVELDISNVTVVGVQAVWAGLTTPSGTVQAKVSNDGGTTYTDLGSGISVSGAAGNGVESLADVAHQKLRVDYDFTSGSGTGLQVYVTVKGQAG